MDEFKKLADKLADALCDCVNFDKGGTWTEKAAAIKESIDAQDSNALEEFMAWMEDLEA